MPLTLEEKEEILQYEFGVNPSEYDLDDNTLKPVKKPTLQPAITSAPISPISKQQQNNTAVGAFAANMGAGIVPTAAALTGAKVVGGLAGRWLGAKAGAGAGAAVGTVAAPGPGTIVGTVAGGLLGALGGGYIASKAQGAALEALAPSVNRALESYQETNPIASAAGNVAAALPLGMRFDPKVISESGTALRKLVSGGRSPINEVDVNALANVGIGAGVGGGMAAYDISQTGREIGGQDAVNILGNILLNNPRTGFANKIGMESNQDVRDRAYKRGAIGGLAEDDPNVILGVSGKSPTDAGSLFVPANVADKKGSPAKTYKLNPNKKNVVNPIIADAKQKTADVAAAVETVKAVQEEEVKQAAKIAEVTEAPAKPSEAAMEQARLKREAYAKSLIKPSTAADATLTKMDAATTEAEVDALRAELQAEQQAEELARIQAAAPQERDQPSSGIAERKGVIVPALDAEYPPRVVGKNEKGEDVKVKSWGLNPAFVKLFKRFAGTRNTGLEANTKEGDSGRSYITTKDGKNTVYLGDNASLDTPAHEIGFHSVHDYLATSKSKIDRELLRKHFEAIRKSPEMQQWYNDLGRTEKGRIRRAKLDRERYVRGDIDVPAAVEEFSAEVGGYDFLLTDRAISGESATKKLFNDIIAHVDTRINDKPSLKNLQRHMAYRARFDAPYDPNTRIDVKTVGERERNAGNEPQAPAYDPNLSGAENMRIAAEWGAKHPADIATLEPSIKPLTNERDNEGGRYRNDPRYQDASELFAEEIGDFNWRARPAVEYKEQQAERAMQKQSREELAKRIQQFADEAFGNLSSDAYVRYQMAKDYIDRPDAVARKSKSNSTFADSKPLHEHAVDMLGEQRISRFFSDIQAISDKKAAFGERNQPASELHMFPDDKQPIRDAEAFYESHASRAKLRNMPIEKWSLEEVGAYTGLSRQAASELRKKYGQAYDFHTHAANRYPKMERVEVGMSPRIVGKDKTVTPKVPHVNQAVKDDAGNVVQRDRPLQLKVEDLTADDLETIRRGVVDTMNPAKTHAIKGTAMRNSIVRAMVQDRYGNQSPKSFKSFEQELQASVAGRIKAEGLDNDANTTYGNRVFKTAGRIAQQELKAMYLKYIIDKAHSGGSLDEMNRVGNARLDSQEDASSPELPNLDKAFETAVVTETPSVPVVKEVAPPKVIEAPAPKVEASAKGKTLATVLKDLEKLGAFEMQDAEGNFINERFASLLEKRAKQSPNKVLSEAEVNAIYEQLDITEREQPDSLLNTAEDDRLMITSVEKELKSKARPFNIELNKDGQLKSSAILARVKQQVSTPEFKAWFGDSKVRGYDKQPKVMWHATTDENVDYYTREKLEEPDKNFYEFKTTGNRTLGAHFGTEQAAKERGRVPLRMIPVYLSIQNPFNWSRVGRREAGFFSDNINNIVQDVAEQTYAARKHKEGELTVDMYRGFMESPEGKALDKLILNEKGYTRNITDKEGIEFIKSLGYDGISYVNASEDAGSVSYIAFDPAQIKSATDNNGKFNPTNPDIRYQPSSLLNLANDPITPPEKAASLFGIEPVLDEMVRHHGNVGAYMADKFRLAKENETALSGEFANKALGIVNDLLKGPKDWILGYNESTKKIMNALNYMSDNNGAVPSHISLTPAEQKAMQGLRDLFIGAHDEQRANGPMVARIVDGKTIYDAPKDNPYYMPHIMAPDVIEHMMKFPAGATARKYREDFRTYRRSLGQSDSEIDDALTKFQPNKAGTATTPDYNAVRMEEGLGLPKSWREQDLSRLLRRYYSRWATDMGFYRAVQSDPVMRKLLDIKDDGQGNLGNAVMADTLPNGENIRDVNMNSTPEVQTVMRDFGGSYPVSDVKVNAINRLIKAFMMQTATGLYDVTTALPVAAKLLRPSEIGLMGKALLKWKEGRQIGYDNGTIRRGVSSIQDLRGLDTGLSNTLDMITNTVNKITGREGLEGVARGLTNELGYLVNESRLSGARAGNAEDIKWYKQLGIKDWQTRDVDDVGKEVAARFTELNQGTYDYRGLPRWALEGSLSPFLSLAKWNIEQFNNWNKTVINPAREGNYAPLLMSTVGAIVGGAAVEELRKLINNRKPTQLTNEEWWNTTEDTAYKLAALASLAGYAGIMGELAKNVTFDIPRGNRPQGFTFPLAETAANTMDRINQLAAALDENIKPSEALIPFIQNLLTDNIQVARMAERLNERVNEPEKAEQAAASRDARVFKQVVQGERVDSSSARTNPMLRPDERKFKKADSIEDAATILPKIVEDAIKRSGGDYEKLKREMQRLKGNNIQTFPSPETNPVEFAKQYAWYVQSQGKEAADAAVQKFMTQRAINKAKASWVPKI